MRSIIFTTLFVLLSLVLFAGPNSKFIYHTVEKGETLYSISHQYGLKPQDLAPYNETIGEKLTVKIGQKLKIPAPDSGADAVADAPATAAPAHTAQTHQDYHVVQKGETVFSISKMYDVSKEDLMAWNKIRDNKIAIGQKLLIKGEANPSAHTSPASTPAMANEAGASKSEVEKAIKKDGYTWTLPGDQSRNTKSNVSTASGDVTASTAPAGLAETRVVKSWKAESTTELRDYYNKAPASFDASSEYESLFYQNVYSGLTKKTETGVAKLIQDNNTTNIAFYNNAAVGTILKLTNADNGKTTYAIVVGKVPPGEENSYMMKLSGKVGRNLGVKDYSSVEIVCYTGN